MKKHASFLEICKKSQEELKQFVIDELSNSYSDVVVGDGYVLAKGDFPVLLTAHLDTVHENLPSQFIYDKKLGAVSSPEGIGGDDRCGVYMILEIIKKYKCSVIFFEDEELGEIGAKKFVKTKDAENLSYNYILELDRKNSNDAVFYGCKNQSFIDFITKKFFKFNTGTASDISIIAPFFNCGAVNLSCGYYNMHTTEEYVLLKDMDKSLKAVLKILKRTTSKDKFTY